MDAERTAELSPTSRLTRTEERLALYQRHLSDDSPKPVQQPATAMARDPITCHVLNTLTGTPAANLPCTLTLLSGGDPSTFNATTDSDGRVKTWTILGSDASSTISVSTLLASLAAPDAKTNWSIRFDVGPWFESQGIESFWPEVEVKFTVRGRGIEGEDGWRHYHVPVLLGPWSYSTYRGS
jgi:5-hydroxyisourate hydrolase